MTVEEAIEIAQKGLCRPIDEQGKKDVKVDASSVPDVEWRGICAVLLPAIRAFYGLDDEKGGGRNEIEDHSAE